MSKLKSLRATVVAAALVAWPLMASAQNPQSNPGATQQGSSATGQQQSGTEQQPPQGQGQGFGQGQGQADTTRQEALNRLTAARQSLAEMTKLPAAAQLDAPARNEINQLITNFNALISSTGPEWRQSYDQVQASLATLLGPPNVGDEPLVGGTSGSTGTAGSAGTSGTTGGSAAAGAGSGVAANVDPTIKAKLGEVRQHVNDFGRIVGVQSGEAPGQAPASATSGSVPPASGTAAAAAGTAGAPATVNTEAALRNIEQINAILSRVMAQPAEGDSVTVSKEDLQQIQQYLTQLRQAVGGNAGGR